MTTCLTAAKDLEEAADAVETPEEKKRLSNAAKGGLAAMGAALIAAGLYAAGKACKAAAEKKGQDPKAVAKLLVKYADTLDKSGNAAKAAVKGAIQNAGDAAASRRVGKAEQAAVKAAEDKERADRFLVNQAEKAREKAKKVADKEFAKYQKAKANESFLSSLAFGLEGVMVNDEDVDDDKIEPMEGKAFDDEDLIEEATEAAIAVMMAEDGIDDSDIE